MIDKHAKIWIGGIHGFTPPIHLSQYDTGWRFLFSVYNGGSVYVPQEKSVVLLEGRKADHTVFSVPGSFDDGVAVVECTSSITSAVGTIMCELRISVGGKVVGTANFEMFVEEAPLSGYIASNDDFSAMKQLLDKTVSAASSALESKDSAKKSAADAAQAAATAQVEVGASYSISKWRSDMDQDRSKTYVYVGTEDGMVYGGRYYWDTSDFDWKLIGTEVDPTLSVEGAAADAAATGEIKNNLAGIRNDIIDLGVTVGERMGWEKIKFVDGKYYPLDTYIDIDEPSSENGWRCALVPCKGGDTFMITGKGVTNPLLYMFINSERRTLQGAISNLQIEDGIIDAPADSAYLIINDSLKTGDCWKGVLPPLTQILGATQKTVLGALAERMEIYANENLYDWHNLKVGHIQPANGSIDPTARGNYHYSPTFAPVSYGDRLCASIGGIVNYYDENRAWLSGESFTTDGFDVPYGAHYARFSVNTLYQTSVIINKGNALNTNARQPYSIRIKGLVDKEVVTVAADGSGNYASLTRALYETNADLIVYAGTYDIVEEYKDLFGYDIFTKISDSYTSIGYFRYGAYITERKVTFVAGANVVCDLTNVLTVDGTHRFCPFNLGTNVVLDGLVCHAERVFYLIHDDFGVNEWSYTNKIENCVLTMSNPVNRNVIGGGTREHSTKIVENCYMDNGLDSNSETMRYHNYDSPNAQPTVIVKNCRVNGKIGARYYGKQSTPRMKFIAHNNSTGGGVAKIAETSSSQDNVDLLAWNNVIE